MEPGDESKKTEGRNRLDLRFLLIVLNTMNNLFCYLFGMLFFLGGSPFSGSLVVDLRTYRLTETRVILLFSPLEFWEGVVFFFQYVKDCCNDEKE